MRSKKLLRQYILLAFTLFNLLGQLHSQDSLDYIDISKINVSLSLHNKMQVHLTDLKTNIRDSLPYFKFIKDPPYLHAIPPGIVSKKPVIHFIIVNPTDSRSKEHTSELQSRENLVC